MLLVLDNCEHLLDACAQLIDGLLRTCPDVRVLATSREPIGIGGEVAWRVPSLELPDAEPSPTLEQLGENPAVQLFVQRAMAARPRFALTVGSAQAVVQICRRLDGIPLALELAAARIEALTAEQIAQRLDQRFRLLTGGSRAALPRQQTLGATLDWSYDLLGKQERLLFERLAVFAGGWTLEAVEAVCAGRGLDSEDVLDVLAQLTRKSLVVADEVANGAERYWLQETVRDYARQKLAMRGAAKIGALRERHAEFYASMVEQQLPDSYFLTRAESAEPYALQLALLEDLAVDLNNVRAALGWYFDRGAVEEGLRLAAALGQLWSHLGRPSEGYDWLRRFLDLPPGVSTARTRSRAQCWAGALALIVGEASAGYALLVDSLAYGRTAQDDVVLGEAANRLGLLTLSRGEYARARQLFEESLAAQRRLGNAEQAIRSTRFLAVAMVFQGDYAAARPLLEQGLAEARAIGYQHWAAAIPGLLGGIAMAHGEYTVARGRLQESLRMFEGAPNWVELTAVQTYLASLDVREGNLTAARAGYAASLRLSWPARFVIRIATSLNGLAVVAAAQGQMARALRLASASAALLQRAGYRLPPDGRLDLEQAVEAARRTLGAADAAEVWAAGQALTLDQAVYEALDEPHSA
jgi:predicted ATPase